jgi:hypothetical protein
MWQSLYFFRLSKDTERNVAISLSKIEAQVQALESLTGRWMDRFTRHATRELKPDTVTLTLIEKLEGFRQPQQQLPQELIQQVSSTRQEAVDMTIAAAFYAALTNFNAQWWVPAPEMFDEKNTTHSLGVRHTDQSYADCQLLMKTLFSLPPDAVQHSRVKHLYDELAQLVPLLRTSSQCFADLAKQRAQGPVQ